MALSRRVEHSGGLRLSLSGTVRSWSNFYDLFGPGHIRLFFLFFFIVSRPTKQRHQIVGYYCEKVFFDMHSGRLSICSISTDVTFVTDFPVNRPV